VTIAVPQASAANGASSWRADGANAALTAAAALWFVTALAGQWAFLYYIAGFYGAATLRGDFAAWSRNTHLLNGYVPGDTSGNLAFAAHVLLAIAVTFGGALQLVPLIRARCIALHRWNGRLFLVTAVAGALSGLYMIWVRGSRANFTAGLATSIAAVLIIAFAWQAWRAARAKQIAVHRRWALRTWIVANTVWFQRIGIFGWMIANHGTPGMSNHFDGWFDIGWEFGCWLLPLAVLELYLRVKDGAGPRGRYAMAAGILFLTAVMGFCIYSAHTFVWRPFLFRLGL
jgi:uncharacterized membrane protein